MNKEVYKRVKEHLQELNKRDYEVVFISLQGSQNYGLDVYDNEYKSDVDTKAVILPSFEDFVYNKAPISETLILDNNEHIDVKDIRVMLETFKKQNVNFIEILFSEYCIINSKYNDLVKPLFENKEKIAHLNVNQALRCMAGMSMEKLKAMEHPYPTIIDKIEKYGYDPKQLHHIYRMNDFIKKYISGLPYEKCLIPSDKELLLKIKKGAFTLDEARLCAVLVDKETKKIKDENLTEKDIVDNEAINILDKVKYDLLKKRFKEELEV